ncbi:MAG: SOS response-associated peptidase family protein [Methylocystaceae bacterium]|nr:SOS response-associated peptidase family protein [Methylocystaceae bacterium]
MCSNFDTVMNLALMQDYFALSVVPKTLGDKANRRPSDDVYLVLPRQEISLKGWGLKVDWSNKPLINARIETVNQKPTYQGLLQNRCLVPVSCWYEWRQDHGQKYKNKIQIKNAGIFAFAGIWQEDRFTILTQEASPEIKEIHHRMPVVVNRDDFADWLNPDNKGLEVIASISQKKAPTFQWEEERPKNEQFSLF